MPEPLLSLPLLNEASAQGGQWQGLSPIELLPAPTEPATSAPEPDLPQGVYQAVSDVQLRASSQAAAGLPPTELLAPAGGPDAAYAAFHYGADAIYLGLKKFSARAEAENFTLDELAEVTAYAHQLTPRRRVFVTVNTLIRQDELPELVETIVGLVEIGVDALIIQDLGVYHLVRRWFPDLELHASTQLAVHNRDGAEALHALGFARVVLARELTFEEVNDITASAGIETEVFIHGALCYSYSGLCLFSSQTLGRSGNRGKCAYSCRDSFEVTGAPETLRDGSSVKRNPAQGFPFSMKDLALPDHLPALRSAGVSCFKIEGRKKSPLYVATTTDYYRRLLDGRLPEDERAEHEADLQTVFSRPWTQLFVQSHKDKEVADRDTVGHRGSPIGKVESVRRHAGESRLRFRTIRPLERHDGLQIDLPVLGKPYGFAVDRIWLGIEGRTPRPREVFEAPAGSLVEVSLPKDAPLLPEGAPVYCSSSQAVKRMYRASHPKPGQFHTQHSLTVRLSVQQNEISATASMSSPFRGDETLEACESLSGAFAVQARDASEMARAAQSAFEKLGDTIFSLSSFSLDNPQGLFVPISRLNRLRRMVTKQLAQTLIIHREQLVGELRAEVQPAAPCPAPTKQFQWSIKVDQAVFLSALEPADFENVDEVIVDITRDHSTTLFSSLEGLAGRVGKERIRLALPAVTRKWEERGLLHKIDCLRKQGWTKWEAANLSAWSFLGLAPNRPVSTGLDVATDWSIYVLNRLAALQLRQMGVCRFALSPEDGLANFRSLLAEFGPRAVVIVYQDTPLFLAESCAYANLIGGCPGKANCRFESMEMVSSHGERVLALDYHCRTIVLNQGPFCLSTRLRELAAAGAQSLRADFVYKAYAPALVRDTWRAIRAGRGMPSGHCANFDRGVL